MLGSGQCKELAKYKDRLDHYSLHEAKRTIETIRFMRLAIAFTSGVSLEDVPVEAATAAAVHLLSVKPDLPITEESANAPGELCTDL